jgi:SAM-dependent methyltransferase
MQNNLTSKWLECIGQIGCEPARVLQIGRDDGLLESHFRERQSNLVWQRAALPTKASGISSAREESTCLLDWDGENFYRLKSNDDAQRFDLILLDDTYCRFRDPKKILWVLNDLLAEGGSLLTHLPNAQHFSQVQSALVGNWPPSPKQSNHGVAIPELVKNFLDAGWLPDLLNCQWYDIANDPTGFILVEAACKLGVSEEMAKLQLGRLDFWVHAVKSGKLAQVSGPSMPLSVIVPVTRDWQLECNLLASPGLKEIDAEIIVVRGASSAADAYQQGSAQAKHDWRLFIHQDVYIPVGSGQQIAKKIAQHAISGKPVFAAGFLGLEAVQGTEPVECRYSGCVIDRTRKYAYNEIQHAISLDEFAVIMHRANPIQIDPNLGWHLWATDLCLQAKFGFPSLSTPVLSVPIFHNTVGQYTVPKEFFMSGVYLLDKYPSLNDLPAVCGNLIRDSFGNKRFEEPVRLQGPHRG